MPFFFERSHYQAIGHLLTAGDVASRIVHNDNMTGIEVKLETGEEIIWSNVDPKGWGWTRVSPEGDLTVGVERTLSQQAEPETVAAFIASYPYEAALEPTT